MNKYWRHSGLILAFGLLVLGIAFAHEARAAFDVWGASTAYNHCFLILPITLYLGWERRAGFVRLIPTVEPRAIFLAIAFALLWLAADRLGIMEGRQLAAMALLQCLVLAALGSTVYWYFRAPLWYLFFLVPFGGFTVAPLQHFTADFAAAGLSLLGINHYLHGTIIEISAGAFRIAQACAGLRFLIAAIAFSVLYALVIFRSTGRRLIFIALCLIVPVIANGLRALGIIWLGYMEGSAKAAATDHVVYGYVFFSILLMIIILVGLPFRQDSAPPAIPLVTQVPISNRARMIIALAVLAVSLAAPAVALALDLRARRTTITPPDHLGHWRLIASPAGSEPAGAIRRDFVGPHGFTVTIIAFPPGTAPEPIFDLRRTLGLIDLREAHLGLIRPPGKDQAPWQLAMSNHRHRMAASDLVINGHLTLGSLITRVHMLAGQFTDVDSDLIVVVTAPNGLTTTTAAMSQILENHSLQSTSLREFTEYSNRSRG